jgi:hypothetical protein
MCRRGINITDPVTKPPAVRNLFMDEPSLGVKALQARGTIFWQCAIARLRGVPVGEREKASHRRGARRPDRRSQPRRQGRFRHT